MSTSQRLAYHSLSSCPPSGLGGASACTPPSKVRFLPGHHPDVVLRVMLDVPASRHAATRISDRDFARVTTHRSPTGLQSNPKRVASSVMRNKPYDRSCASSRLNSRGQLTPSLDKATKSLN